MWGKKYLNRLYLNINMTYNMGIALEWTKQDVKNEDPTTLTVQRDLKPASPSVIMV